MKPPAEVMSLSNGGGSVPALVITPHPISLDGQRLLTATAAQFVPGDTLADLLERQGVVPGRQWVVSIGGVDVPEQHWHRVRPKHGHLIEARRLANKDILRIVAIAVLSYFTFGAGGLAGGSFLGFTGAAGYIAAGAAFVAGSLVINKLLGPKAPTRPGEQSVSPTYSLNGGRNRARPYEPIGLVLGEPYAVPDYGAQPYTFFANGEQHLWQIFNLGINCADAHTLRIGQTALSVYQGVTVLRSGLASGNSPFPALGGNVDSVAGAALNNGVGWVTRTTSPGTVRLALDFVASLYEIHPKTGAFLYVGVALDVFYRPLGSGTWLPFTPYVPGVPAVTEQLPNLVGESQYQEGWITHVITPAVPEVPAGRVTLYSSSQKPVRHTVELAVPPGQYEVQVRKASADYFGDTGNNASNQVEWTQLRGFQLDSGNYDGQARLAIQIQASGQLNGMLDEVNMLLRSKPMPCWNGFQWATATDRASGLCNPGALFLLLARGIFDNAGRRLAGLGYSDDQIDIEGLKRFMVHCTVNNFHFDLNLQETISIDDLLSAIAYAGMGEKSESGGKLGVMFFSREEPLRGVINMGNIRARSFSVDYETLLTVDELEFQYFDRQRGNTWQPVRVLAPGVTMPRSTGRQNLVGVTEQGHAAKLARFSMAQNIFQRKSVTLEMDLEYITFKRGHIVALSHDLTQWGFSGRLLACEEIAGEIHLTLDDVAPGENPLGGAAAPWIGLRLPGEMQMRAFAVKSFVGDARQVVLDEPWPEGVALPGSSSANPACDTLWLYDFKPVPGQLMYVFSIEPSQGRARVALTPWSEEFWDFVESGLYQPPPNNSLLRPPPTIKRVIVTEQLARQGNAYHTELFLSADIDGMFARAELWGSVGEGDIAPPLQKLAESTSQTLQWRGGLDERWHLELRAFSEFHQAQPYRLMYDVQGLRVPPPNVEAIGVSGDTLSWPAVDVPDLAGYLLRFQYGNNPWWNTATPLHEGVVTESPYQLIRRPQGLVTLLIKAVDTTGNESEEATWIVYSFPELPVANVLVDFPQHPAFSGSYSGGSVVGGELLATATDQFWEPALAPFWTPSAEPFWGTSQYGTLVYEFDVTPAHAGTLVLQHDIEGDGLLIEYQVAGTEPFWEPASDPFWEPPEALFWGTPSAWSVWPGALVFDGVGRIQFRITVAPGIAQGAIRALTAVLDVPDITERLGAVAIGSGGARLPITKTYTSISTVHLTVQGGGAGISARWLDKDPALGPLVDILDATGTPVAGVLDADIQGY